MCLKQVLRETELLYPSLFCLPVREQPALSLATMDATFEYSPVICHQAQLPPPPPPSPERRLLEPVCFLHGRAKPQGMLPSRLLLTAGRCRASEARKQSSPEARSSLAGIPGDSGQQRILAGPPLPSHLMVALQDGGEGGAALCKAREPEGRANPSEIEHLPASGPSLLLQAVQRSSLRKCSWAPEDPLPGSPWPR